jgi:hypothetical protein
MRHRAHVPYRFAARAFALASSSCRFFGGAVERRESSNRPEILAISSTAVVKAASFTLDGVLEPLIFRTNWSEAARISSSLAGGSKLNNGLIFLHMPLCPFPDRLQSFAGALDEDEAGIERHSGNVELLGPW